MNKIILSSFMELPAAQVFAIPELCARIFGHFDRIDAVIAAIVGLRRAYKWAGAALAGQSEYVRVTVNGRECVSVKHTIADITIRSQFIPVGGEDVPFIKRLFWRGNELDAGSNVVHIWKCGKSVETNRFNVDPQTFSYINALFNYGLDRYQLLLARSGEPPSDHLQIGRIDLVSGGYTNYGTSVKATSNFVANYYYSYGGAIYSSSEDLGNSHMWIKMVRM